MTQSATPPAEQSGTFSISGDLPVHRLGYGVMQLPGPGVWGPPRDHDEAVRVLRRAVELGVDFIDTADSYGPEVSEELIAEALAPYPDGLVIATKGGLLRDGPGQWRPDGRPEHLRQALDGSLQRLRADVIDLYQLHRPDPTVPFEDSVGTLAELRDAGKIRHVGLSNVDADQVRRAQAIVPVVSVEKRYKPPDRASEDVVGLAEKDGFAFIPWAPVGGHRPGAGDALATVAERHDATPIQVALAWQLARSPQMLPIPGTGSVAHLEENVAAGGLRLTDEDLAALG